MRLGLPGVSCFFPCQQIQLTTRWWSVDSSAPLFTGVSKTEIRWHDYKVGGGCCSVGRAGGLVIRRSPVLIPAPLGGTELHVEVSLSKILNPKVAPDVQMPSVRVLRWAGNSSRVYPGRCLLCELDLAPVSPTAPRGGNGNIPRPLRISGKKMKQLQSRSLTSVLGHPGAKCTYGHPYDWTSFVMEKMWLAQKSSNTTGVQIGEAVPPNYTPPGDTVAAHVSVEVPQ